MGVGQEEKVMRMKSCSEVTPLDLHSSPNLLQQNNTTRSALEVFNNFDRGEHEGFP